MITLSDHAPSPRISPRSRSVCQSDASNVAYESDHFSSLSGSISDISVSPADDDEAYLRSTDPSASTGDEILTPTSCAFGTGSRTPLSEGSELKAFKFRTDVRNTSSTDTGSTSCMPTPRSNLIRLSSKIGGDNRISHALGRRYQERLDCFEDEQRDHYPFGESDFRRSDLEDDSEDDCLYLSLPWVIQVDDDVPTTKAATSSSSSSSRRRKFSKKVFFILSLSVAIPSTITLVILLVL